MACRLIPPLEYNPCFHFRRNDFQRELKSFLPPVDHTLDIAVAFALVLVAAAQVWPDTI